MPYTRVLPKPLLPVGDRPVLEIIVAQLRDAGMAEVVLATGWLSGLIEAYFGDGERFGIEVTYHREANALGTAGPLAFVDMDEDTLIMNGDVLTQPIYRGLIDAHRSGGAEATIATRTQTIDVDFGVLKLVDGDGEAKQIVGIDEKPSAAYPVSTGIHVFSPNVRDYIRAGEYLDLPELIARMVANGELVAAYPHEGLWFDIGQLHRFDDALRAGEGEAIDYLFHDIEQDPRADPDAGTPKGPP